MNYLFLTTAFVICFYSTAFAGDPLLWNQWRGPNRDGFYLGNSFPSTLNKDSLQLTWKGLQL